MTLPARGTNVRRMLDMLADKPVTKRQQINHCLSDISRKHIIKMLDEQVERGNVAQTEDGYSLTEQAIELYRYESTRKSYETKPLSRQYMISPLGTRPGSNDYKEWGSRHVE